MKPIVKYIATGVVVLIAVGMIAYKYYDYTTNPWTRDGLVRAEVIQIATRVSGPLVRVPIRNNQLVKKGDLLFEIDPSTYKATVNLSRAQFDNMRDIIESLDRQVDGLRATVGQRQSGVNQAKFAVESSAAEAENARTVFERAKELLRVGVDSQRDYDNKYTAYQAALAQLSEARAQVNQMNSALAQAKDDLARGLADLGAPGADNPRLRRAAADLELAQLNLDFTKTFAPTDGYVTNLRLRVGDFAVANQPVLAVIDVSSFYVQAFFRETFVGNLQSGDRAVVTLMSYPDAPLQGRVDSIGWGIAQQNGAPASSCCPRSSRPSNGSDSRSAYRYWCVSRRFPTTSNCAPAPRPRWWFSPERARLLTRSHRFPARCSDRRTWRDGFRRRLPNALHPNAGNRLAPMSSLHIALVVFGCSFVSALVGMALKLPDHHRDPDSRDAVKLVMGLIATISALVLSLLIVSANSQFNTQRSELQSLSANVILLDRLLISYGPEAKESRDGLRDVIVVMHDRIWSPGGVKAADLGSATKFLDQVQSLTPKTESQRSMHLLALRATETLLQTRLLMFEQLGHTISGTVLTVLVGWICVLFLGFGLFTRFNVTVIVALLLGALSVSGAIFIIVDLGEPFSGLLRVSDAPLLNALAQIKQ